MTSSVATEPSTFHFNVGPYKFRVVFVRGLVDDEGAALHGWCDADTTTIYIEAEHTGRNIEETLVHELSHAWDYVVGQPKDAEAIAERTRTLHVALWKDLADQGGIAAMNRERRRFAMSMASVTREPGATRLVVADDVEQQDAAVEARGGRAWCGRCGKQFADGQIVTQKQRWDREAKGAIVRRTLHCSHCRHLQSWDEGLWLGAPNGAVVRGPFYVTGPEVEEFLRQNPNAAGVAG